MIPFEVSYTRTGRRDGRVREVTAVMCPTPIAQRLGVAKPIFVRLGDVEVDWTEQTDGYRTMFELGVLE